MNSCHMQILPATILIFGLFPSNSLLNVLLSSFCVSPSFQYNPCPLFRVTFFSVFPYVTSSFISGEATWSLLRMLVRLYGVNREVKHHVYVKQRTQVCTTWQSFPFTCRLLFIISTHKLVVSRNFLTKRIVLSCFYLLIFYFAKFSTWIQRLPYTWSLNSLIIVFWTSGTLRSENGDANKTVAKSALCFLSFGTTP